VSKDLRLFRAAWGIVKEIFGTQSLETFVANCKAEKYHGVEMPVVLALGYGKDKMKILKDNNLQYIGMIFTDGPMAPGDPCWNGKFNHPEPSFTPKQSIEVFKKQVEAAISFGACKVNSHSLRDFYSEKDASIFFEEALKFQEQIPNIPIMHETHRKRYLYSPWVCRDFVSKYPNLKLVADLSHFTCVAEVDPSSIELTQVIENLASQVYHIHGRIGYDHGPQVSDPRAPEWLPYVEGFEKWWSYIFSKQIENNKIMPTLTPEHGPPNYQVCLPYTRQPIADIWEVNSFIGKRAQSVYNKISKEKSY